MFWGISIPIETSEKNRDEYLSNMSIWKDLIKTLKTFFEINF